VPRGMVFSALGRPRSARWVCGHGNVAERVGSTEGVTGLDEQEVAQRWLNTRKR